MRHGWKSLALYAAFAVTCAAVTPTAHAASKSAAKPSTPKETRAAESLRQFTGILVAVDSTSITVEKGGKQPKIMVFEKHDEMRTKGRLDEGARVTVYYRGKGKRAIAHRVVVKPEKTGSKRRR